MIFFRFFQAVSGSVSTVCGRAAIADLLSGNELAKTYSFLGLILTIAPIIATLIGGWINDILGWRFIFLFMTIFGLIFFLISFMNVKETLKIENRTKFKINNTTIEDEKLLITNDLFDKDKSLRLSLGKKRHIKVKLV